MQNAFKIDPRDIDSAAALVAELLKNPEKMEAAGLAGAREVKRIDWKQAGSLMKNIYKELLC